MTVLVGAAVVGIVLTALVPWRPPARGFEVSSVGARTPEWFRPGGAVWGGLLVAAIILMPPVAVPVMMWPSWRRWSTHRRGTSDQRGLALRTLPETADLIALGVGAGLSPRAAVRVSASWMSDPYRSTFGEALRRAEAGEPFALALDAGSNALDPVARPLVALLVSAETDGGSMLASLRRVSDDARRRRRAVAEARARRLPVTMLLPLVFCILPAFGLLAVVPMLLGALDGIDLGL